MVNKMKLEDLDQANEIRDILFDAEEEIEEIKEFIKIIEEEKSLYFTVSIMDIGKRCLKVDDLFYNYLNEIIKREEEKVKNCKKQLKELGIEWE